MTAQLIDSESPAGETRIGGKRRSWVLAAASVASFMVALDLLVVTTSLDTIRRDLGTATGSLQWIVTAYGVSFAAMLLTGAALGDRFGRRRTMSIGLAVFALGSAGAALAPGVGALIASRGPAGRGRRDRAADRVDDRRVRVPAESPRDGDRHFGRSHRVGRDRRPGRGRGDLPLVAVAVDLLDQRADRGGRDPRRRKPSSGRRSDRTRRSIWLGSCSCRSPRRPPSWRSLGGTPSDGRAPNRSPW